MSIFTSIGRIYSQFNTQLLKSINHAPGNSLQKCNFNITRVSYDLMEFFDDKKHWGAREVKSGRSWKAEELRLKSNTDLHKLWYVLLKERNMLLTMEEESNDQVKLFPSPERIDKIEESMKNLETIVRERNKAYHELETGENGERPTEYITGPFGLNSLHKKSEHLIPKHINVAWWKKNTYPTCKKDVEDFLSKYREKRLVEKKKQNTRDFNHVIGLLKRFPNMDMEALKAQYPNVNIEKAKSSRKCRGHFTPK